MIGDTAALRATGVTDPGLRAAYLHCRRLLLECHGRSYWAASLLAPPHQRAGMWAVYGFARYTDDIVDVATAADGPARDERHRRLDRWESDVRTALRGGASDHPVLRAVLHAIGHWGLDSSGLLAQLRGHRRDLTTTDYDTFADLCGYMDDVAGAFARMLVPILEPRDPIAASRSVTSFIYAVQLTDLVQDLAFDLQLGRLYLPREDLDRHGITRADVERAQPTTPVRAAVLDQLPRIRQFADDSRALLPLLPAATRPVFRTGLDLSLGVVAAIEARGGDVFSRRPRRSPTTTARVAARMLSSVLATRLGWGSARQHAGQRPQRGPVAVPRPSPRC